MVTTAQWFSTLSTSLEMGNQYGKMKILCLCQENYQKLVLLELQLAFILNNMHFNFIVIDHIWLIKNSCKCKCSCWGKKQTSLHFSLLDFLFVFNLHESTLLKLTRQENWNGSFCYSIVVNVVFKAKHLSAEKQSLHFLSKLRLANPNQSICCSCCTFTSSTVVISSQPLPLISFPLLIPRGGVSSPPVIRSGRHASLHGPGGGEEGTVR